MLCSILQWLFKLVQLSVSNLKTLADSVIKYKQKLFSRFLLLLRFKFQKYLFLFLANFAESAKGKNGEEIGALLESSEEIANLHKSTSQAESNQTQADESTKVRDHFVALVNVNNTLYEVRTALIIPKRELVWLNTNLFRSFKVYFKANEVRFVLFKHEFL